MASDLSKKSVGELINEEAEKQKGQKQESGGIVSAVLKGIGGMVTPKTASGKAANVGDYKRYVIDEQSAGRAAKSFEDWSKSN